MQKNSSIWSSGTTSITLNVQSATENTKKMVNQTNQKMTNKEITYFKIFYVKSITVFAKFYHLHIFSSWKNTPDFLGLCFHSVTSLKTSGHSNEICGVGTTESISRKISKIMEFSFYLRNVKFAIFCISKFP